MTRLAFCIMSNNIQLFHQMDNSFYYKGENIVDSFTKNVLFNPPIGAGTTRWGDWNVKWKSYKMEEYIDYFAIRQDSIDLAGNADFIFVGDDDMIFRKGSTAVINECVQYLINNEQCGAIYLAANFGEAYKYHENEIYVLNNGHLGINRGVVLRNRKEDKMDNRLHALGANDDFIIGYTCVLQGYYICRRLHVPIDHPAKNNRVDTSKNSEYTFMMSKGIMSKVNKHIGKWEDHNQWPENIFKYYTQSVHAKGWKLKYNLDGTIIGGGHGDVG